MLAAVSCSDTNFLTIHLHVRQVSVIDCCHDLNMVLLRLSEVMLAITLCASTQISNHGSLQARCKGLLQSSVPNLTYDVIMSSELCLLESFRHFLLPG